MRSGVRRTTVPPTVGKRRRDGCGLPSGKTIRGPGDPAARALRHEVAQGCDRAGLGARRRGSRRAPPRRRAREPEVDVRGEAERPRRSRAPRPRTGPSPARSRSRAARRPAARAPAATRSSSAAFPCETTIAETFTPSTSPVDLGRPARGLRPGEEPRPLDPGGGEPLALGERPPRGGAEVAVLGVDGRAVRDLAQRRLGRGDHRRAARHRLEHRQPEPLEARRQHERRRAAVELGQLLLGDVAAQVGAAAPQLGRELASFSGPATTSGRPTARAASSAASGFLRAWIAPTKRTYPPCSPPGANAGSTPFGVTVTFAAGTPVARDARPASSARTRSSTWSARRAARGTTVRKTVRSRAPIGVLASSKERSWIVTTERPRQPSGSAYWKCASSGRTRRSRRGSETAIRASWSRAGSSIGSTPSGTSSGPPRHRREREVGRDAAAARGAGS